MRCVITLIATGIATWIVGGCNGSPAVPGESNGEIARDVRDKAEAVARYIGGNEGYGGALMTGYLDHAPVHMGFVDETTLADSGGTMTVRLVNETGFDCTFTLSYFASPTGLVEQSDAVDVPASEQFDLAMPCAEIVGLGNLESPGSTACTVSNGQAVPNTMAVPAFLGLDYTCDGMHKFHLTSDIDDLDADGDTEELVAISEALETHMGFGGPMGYSHRAGEMFGGHGHFDASGPSGILPDDATNGESIFKTGFNLDGERIEFDGGPFWLAAHGGGCAACHGADGSGGLWVMMTNEIAPDIRYATLARQHDDTGDRADDHPPYSDESLARAIRDGVDSAGKSLSDAMPGWILSDKDLADLIEFLKTLDGNDH